jgi:hypothetical protein
LPPALACMDEGIMVGSLPNGGNIV